MWKTFLVISALVLGVAAPCVASDRDDDVGRIDAATQVFDAIMKSPDQSIPQELLEATKCIAIIPGEKKVAFGVGGNYGKGLATCRTAGGWSAPLFLAIGGGSFGLQIGVSSTDLVALFMNDQALQKLVSDKFTIGADATAAAGPVGRHAATGTDANLNAQILTYSRSNGAFVGVSLDGAVVQADKSGDQAMYGVDVSRQEILNGKVPVPEAAQPLVTTISSHAGKTK